MTNATEVTKREMYKALKIVNECFASLPIQKLEEALEAHLEELRKELKSEKTLANRKCEQVCDLTEEHDELRNKLQAFEFANKSSGEFLIEAQELLRSEREVMAHLQAKVKSQRQSIGQLKNDRNNAQALAAVNYQKYQKARQELSELRKSLSGTSAQEAKENAKKEAAEAYQAGFNGVGTPNPHATGTLNHLHWMEGARAKMNFLNQNVGFGGTQFVEFEA